ncbi:hypothetical protein DPMN_076927 [Dreissena polymorpha]|uniref:Uncharacterized protein n=1 Tax=Dreissena polymorpha TaxID=45954 RepID=A0A9D3YN94_DREPO|nr:hypothetical protein DPMN_076927 [Dreissena polymorpha]
MLFGYHSDWYTRFSPGDRGSIPIPGADEFGWWSTYRTGEVSSGFATQRKTTPKLKFVH